MLFINNNLTPDEHGMYWVRFFGLGPVARCENLTEFFRVVNKGEWNIFGGTMDGSKSVGFQLVSLRITYSTEVGCYITGVVKPHGTSAIDFDKAIQSEQGIIFRPTFLNSDPNGRLTGISYTKPNLNSIAA